VLSRLAGREPGPAEQEPAATSRGSEGNLLLPLDRRERIGKIPAKRLRTRKRPELRHAVLSRKERRHLSPSTSLDRSFSIYPP